MILLKIGEGGWVLIGMVSGIALIFTLLWLSISGYFERFKRNKK